MSYAGVAIAGKAGAGKNAFATELQAELGRRGIWTESVAFADELKRELWEVHGLRKEDPGGRELLVELGHGRREKDPDYWVKRLARHVDSLRPFGLLPVVTDMRYLSEMKWARRSRLITVRVDALPMDRQVALTRRGEDPAFVWSEHPSEVELDEEAFDVRFWNPHGGLSVLPHYAKRVADLLDGTAERVAA